MVAEVNTNIVISFFIFIFFYPRLVNLTTPAMVANVTGIDAHVIKIISVMLLHSPLKYREVHSVL